MTLGNRIRIARELAGLSQRELAERIFRVPQSVSMYESDHTTPSADILIEIAKACGCDPAFLASEEPAKHVANIMQNPYELVTHLKALPIRGVIPGGSPNPTEGEPLVSEVLPCLPEHAEAADFVLRVTGDSMEPDFLENDLVAFASPERRLPQPGDRVAAVVDGETTMKVYELIKDVAMLLPLNIRAGHKPIVGDFTIQGVYMWMHRNA